MKTNELIRTGTALLLCTALAGCGAVHAANLSKPYQAGTVETAPADDAFTHAQTDFALSLLRNQMQEHPESNIVLSPYSLAQTLAMSANGAKGTTRSEMEQVLGGGLTVPALNAYFAGNRLPHLEEGKSVLYSANSVWFRDTDSLRVLPDFLQVNADCFGADIFSAAFNDSTVSDMNGWLSDQTGREQNAVQELDDTVMLVLMNAFRFESAWDEKYEKEDIRDSSFTNVHGVKQTGSFMYSEEDVYLYGEEACGFTKLYKPFGGRQYEFCAVLPDESVSLADYVETLTADSFPQRAENACSYAGLPKFSVETDAKLNKTIAAMGMPSAFSGDTADFSGMAECDGGEIYIGSVEQHVRIDVDDEGTKAEGITIQLQVVSSADPVPEGQMRVVLDRPFLYLVRDADTKLPLLIGAVQELS